MKKREALNRLTKLIEELSNLNNIDSDDSKFKKWKRKAGKNIEKIFKESNDGQLLEFLDIEFEDTSYMSSTSTEEDFQKGKTDAITLLESFIEEVQEREYSIDEINYSNIEGLIDTLSKLEDKNFKRFEDNPELDKWISRTTRTISRICGEESKSLHKFKSIEFLYTGSRGMSGVEVPFDVKTFNIAKSNAKALLESIKEEMEEGMYSNVNNEIQSIGSQTQTLDKTKVFIVHGHDEIAKQETARFVENLGLEAIILHEQVSASRTIVEKIEYYGNKVGYAIILYTECDYGGKSENELKHRARQNVVFEHGYFIAHLNRENVCALVKGKVETPGDIDGVIYEPMDVDGAWKIKVAKELRASGYAIDLNELL